MAEQFRVLTVCTGNVHRSPLAQVLLHRWADWYLPPALASAVHIESAGLAAPDGQPMGELAAAIAGELGADPDDCSAHRARSLTDEMVSGAGLVLTASVRQRDALLARVPSALRRTFTIREAGRSADAVSSAAAAAPGDFARIVDALADGRRSDPARDDIIDPQGHGDDAYRQMVAEEVGALARLGHVLWGMPNPDLEEYRKVASDPASLGSLASPGDSAASPSRAAAR